jgi:transcriptional regulator with PAS, ATPase and Fis domain
MAENLTDGILRELRSIRERHESQTRELVARARKSGAKSHDIARSLNVSRATLWRRYAHELHRDGDSPLPPAPG